MGEQEEVQEALSRAEVARLVARCGDGDPEALQQFFQTYSNDIYNFPLKVFHLDEDSASDFYLYAFERLKDGTRFRSFKGRSSFRTWFYTVLRNLVIDWMRTIREVETVQPVRQAEDGSEYTLIEGVPDPRTTTGTNSGAASLRAALGALPADVRVVFKLSYIYYLELESEDLRLISERSGMDESEVLRYLARLRHELASRELKNLSSEDKITSLFLSILELKKKRDRLESRNKQPTGSNLSGVATAEEAELERLNRAIEKKYQQRARLLYKRSRGHFIARAPYRFISELLNIPEGSVSVQMMRANEKLRSVLGDPHLFGESDKNFSSGVRGQGS